MKTFFCLWICLVACAAPVRAQTVEVVDELSFGKFVIKDNSSAYDAVTISATGTQTEDSRIIPFHNGQPARAQLTGFTGNMPLTLLLNCGPLVADGGGGAVFDIVDPTYNPPAPVTSPTGTATIDIGATLRTRGVGSYADDDYQATCIFEANY